MSANGPPPNGDAPTIPQRKTRYMHASMRASTACSTIASLRYTEIPPWTTLPHDLPHSPSASAGSWCGFDLPAQLAEAERLEADSAKPGFWDDPQTAQQAMRRITRLRATVERWQRLQVHADTCRELLDLARESDDEVMAHQIADDAATLFNEAEEAETALVLSGEYDERSAIVAIHAGAGGADAQDWAQMLLRMLTRWAESRGYASRLLDASRGEEAGIKSATLEISGEFAYGYVKAERGVHRLVRLSPFDAAHARHTSFALVEALPEAEGDVDVRISPDEVSIETFGASGPGGQHMQKSSTAVRILHHPTGTVVTCQNERSQLQNRETAMTILRSRLMELELERRAEERARLKGEHVAVGWGSQIRSYVLHPYKLVKDHRTGAESTNPDAVLDGAIDPFVRAYLLSGIDPQSGAPESAR